MKLLTSIFLMSLLSVLTAGPFVMAAKPTTQQVSPLGMDVSWPQCGKKLPTDHAFGIVGVNDGLATTTNPCLKDQLSWAKLAQGSTSQEKVQLYVNTANPGGLNTASWPKNNVDPADKLTQNPYGTCDGSDSLPCAWQYGWNRSLENVRDRYEPAATQSGLLSASNYIWWLDVETGNTWKASTSAVNTDSNVAVLEGMVAYFTSAQVRVGLYSTSAQWKQIVGPSVSVKSNLNGLSNWRPGGVTLQQAKDACLAAPLTVGGSVVLTQYVSKSLDYDYPCR